MEIWNWPHELPPSMTAGGDRLRELQKQPGRNIRPADEWNVREGVRWSTHRKETDGLRDDPVAQAAARAALREKRAALAFAKGADRGKSEEKDTEEGNNGSKQGKKNTGAHKTSDNWRRPSVC